MARAFPSPSFWQAGEESLLFLFHLHGFGPLAAYAAGRRTVEGDAFWTSVLGDWLDACGRPSRPAWHPFPMSGRIIAWCAALSANGWPEQLARRMRESLVLQATVLGRSVEHDIGGNHVLRNAVALSYAGICLEQPTLERRGLRLLERELHAQILSDGGHEERSTSYHREILGDLEDLRTLLARGARERQPWLDTHAERMGSWLAALAGPDGSVPLLNDAWEAPAIVAADESFVDLAESGYVVVRDGDWQAVLDVGPLSPPHLPPHAHADALSFVLWAAGRPLVIDPGVVGYTGPARDEFRATRAHNTVEVEGVDQCVFWGDFRAARLPEVRRLRLEQRGALTALSAEHDGYRRLADPVVHRRTFVWVADAGFVVVDRLLASEPHEAAACLHLAPGVELRDGQADGTRLMPLGAVGEPELVDGRYAPFLGTTRPAQTLVRRGLVHPGMPWGWAFLRERTEVSLEGDVVRVTPPGGTPVDVRID